jgi:hypothetical protein
MGSTAYFGFAADIAKSYSGYRFNFYLPECMKRLSSKIFMLIPKPKVLKKRNVILKYIMCMKNIFVYSMLLIITFAAYLCALHGMFTDLQSAY